MGKEIWPARTAFCEDTPSLCHLGTNPLTEHDIIVNLWLHYSEYIWLASVGFFKNKQSAGSFDEDSPVFT